MALDLNQSAQHEQQRSALVPSRVESGRQVLQQLHADHGIVMSAEAILECHDAAQNASRIGGENIEEEFARVPQVLEVDTEPVKRFGRDRGILSFPPPT